MEKLWTVKLRKYEISSATVIAVKRFHVKDCDVTNKILGAESCGWRQRYTPPPGVIGHNLIGPNINYLLCKVCSSC